MAKLARLAPHGGCNWSGCVTCFPEQNQVAKNRDERDACQAGTEGCCIDHVGPKEIDCQSW